MSLVRDMQQITERTYQQWSGINLEEFIIGRQRFADLSALCHAETCGLSDHARVFFRKVSENLYVAIYFSEPLISQLEKHDPRRGLSERNITQFMIFVEEINHGLHGAIKFQDGSKDIIREAFIRDLELQARVDTYQVLKFFLAYFNPSNKLEKFDRLWIQHHLFGRNEWDYASRTLRSRYDETNWLGEKYTRFLDSMSKEERLSELRRFREMDYPTKAQYVRFLP